MLIHQGWFTALYTQHLLDSQSLEFEICIFPRKAIPSHYFPLREYSSRVLAVPSLGLGTTWVRQLRSGSCHQPTAATKCKEEPSRATANPDGGKACSSNPGRFAPKPFRPLVVSPPRRFPPSRFPPSRFAPTSRFAPLVVSSP